MDIRSVRFWLRLALALVGMLLMVFAPPTIPADAGFWLGLTCFALACVGLIVQLMRMSAR